MRRWAIWGAGLVVIALVITVFAVTRRSGPPAAGPTPGTTATTASAAPASSPKATNYRVAGELCAAVDFTPVADLARQPVSAGVGDHSDKSDHTVYTCNQTFRRGSVETSGGVTALLFSGSDAAAHASARAGDTRDNVPTGSQVETVDGVGTLAFGYASASGQGRAYQLWVVDGGLVLGVRVKASTDIPDQLRTAARALAVSTMARLRA